MTPEPCLACGHDRTEHDSEIGYCDECACTSFVAEESFDPAEIIEVEELHLGEES